MIAANSSDKKRIAVIPGDGIGIDVTVEAVKVLKAAAAAGGKTLELTEFDWGADRYLKDGTTLPEGAEDMLRRDFDSVFVGALGDPRVPSMKHAADILLGLRFKLDLYVNSRPVVLLDKRLTPLRDRDEKDIHFIVFRENTEGLYVGMGGIFKKGTPDELATQEDINTRKGVERIIRYAYEYARKHKLTKVCMSDKSNALRFGHDLWQRVFAEVQKEYPEIESNHWYVDALTMQMVKNPAQFQVIVTCNMFGDIVSDLGAQLVGGLGLAPSGNIHPGKLSMFEPVHGSAPKYAGKNVSNPMAAIQTVAIMLDHLGWTAEADAVNNAVRAAVHEGKTTRDLGGPLGTREVGDWLADYVSKQGVAR
ncbi:MAG: 3-isopropylmalate dehydrogenase [Acidobacteria bacterium]|nr:3-isopropylmalate dehydrogenase [Acidobacteriota bacterium]MCL5287502.1 3-isopropylmalate dehydrogenase [Acidobacteriota bacterium]